MTTQQFSVEVLGTTDKAIGGSPLAFPAGNCEIEAHLVEVAPGGRVGAHSHPAICVMYVVEGTLTTELDDGAQQVFKAGDVFVEDGQRSVDNINNGQEPARFFAIVIGEPGEAKVRFGS